MTGAPDLRRAAMLAARTLLERRVDALPVDPLAIHRACRDTRLYTLQEAEDALDGRPGRLLQDADAVTLRIVLAEKLHYIVIYRVDGNPARLRFTLAHELGHRLLGHSGSTDAEEREADCFASHLLCPEPVVRRIRERSADDIEAAGRIAVTCYVSRSCARLALRRPRVQLDPALWNAIEVSLASEMHFPKDE